MDGENYVIYFFSPLNGKTNLKVKNVEKTNYIEKDLNDEEIELYIIKTNKLNDLEIMKNYIEKDRKINFILDFYKKTQNKENTLLKLSYIANYLKKNNVKHLQNLITYLNSQNELNLKYNKLF